MTVDPVQDDIEIVNDGEGTDAFAVSLRYIQNFSRPFLLGVAFCLYCIP